MSEEIEASRIICLCPKCGNDKLEFAYLWDGPKSEYSKKVKMCFRCPKCETCFKFEDVIYEHENNLK